MSQATDYLKASLHRAINQGDKSLSISTLDLKDLLDLCGIGPSH